MYIPMKYLYMYQLISFEDCADFHSKVWKLKRAAWGTSTRIYLAFKMILDACLQYMLSLFAKTQFCMLSHLRSVFKGFSTFEGLLYFGSAIIF